MSKEVTVDRHKVLELAYKAQCDPRTVTRFLSGKPIRDLVRSRLVAACKDAGVKVPK